MRRLLASLFVAVICCSLCFGAEKEPLDIEKPTNYYMEIVGSQPAMARAGMQVSLNMGRFLHSLTGFTEASLRDAVRNLGFSSMIDALNFLSANGWTLVDTYSINLNNQLQVRWVVTKEAFDPMELLDGFVK